MQEFQFTASDGTALSCYRWLPGQGIETRAIVHIAHGMGEHAARYDWLAARLCDNGFAVYANDHRGHGAIAEQLGWFGDDGWNRMLSDTAELIARHREEIADRPVVLLGHSMGAMLAQQFVTRYGGSLNALVLSGSPGFSPYLPGLLMRLLAWFEKVRRGPRAESPMLQSLLFGDANSPFAHESEEPTGFEWLSRDETEVRRYVDDPLCGFVPCPQSVLDLAAGARETQSAAAIAGIPADLPIYLLSGEDDPVHDELSNIDRMLNAWADAGIQVRSRIYPAGRHELFNETNKLEVVTDLIVWLDETLS